MPDQLVIRDQIHGTFAHALIDTAHGLKIMPDLVKRAEAEEIWKERIVHQYGKPIPPFPSFAAYVEATPPDGLGATVGQIEKLVSHDAEALAALRRLTVGKPHVHGDNYNVIIKPRQGNSRAYTLDRLKRERPDLFDQVKDGSLSANAAAKKAGFRKNLTPFEQILKLLPKLSDIQRADLKAILEMPNG